MPELDPTTLTIAGVAPRIAAGEVSPVELTACYLDRIKRLNPVLNAYSTVMEDEALAAAREAEQEINRGNYRGPLHGIPVSIKDNLAVKGYPTTAGSQILKDWKPDFDATVVARLRRPGPSSSARTTCTSGPAAAPP